MRVNFPKSLKGNQFAVTVTVIGLLSGLRAVLSYHTESPEWWLHPCGSSKPTQQLRHARSAGTRQLIISINRMNELKKELQRIYPTVQGKQFQKYGNCLKVNKLVDQVKNSSNILEATTRFHRSLTKIAMFVEQLRQIRLEHQSASFDDSKRANYYSNLKDVIKLSLCEATYDITDQTSEEEPPRHILKLSKREKKCLPEKLDLSKAKMTDFNVMYKILKFLKQSRTKLRVLEKLEKKKRRRNGNKNHQRNKKRTTKKL